MVDDFTLTDSVTEVECDKKQRLKRIVDLYAALAAHGGATVRFVLPPFLPEC